MTTTGSGFALLLALAVFLWGQEPASPPARIGIPYDWSHRHVLFSSPANAEWAMRVRQDPRFWHQYFRRNVSQALPAPEPQEDEFANNSEDLRGLGEDWLGWWHRRRHVRRSPNRLKRDWAMSLGPSATLPANTFPAKFSFDVTTANCGTAAQPDFVVFPTGVRGSSTQASIVAFDNLYNGCGGSVPSIYWAYNTAGQVLTSPVLSLDGSQVAFMESTSPSPPATGLVLLKWSASAAGISSTNPDASITTVPPSQYPTCSAPCMTVLQIAAAVNDSDSSPFYDYANDALYVGDDGGSLHKFHPVFGPGTPAEMGSPWPVLLGSGLHKLTSPVLDSVTGRVFVGNAFNGSTGAQLFAVASSAGSIVATSSSLGKGNGIVDGPIVDSSAGKVYVFVGTDNSPSGTCFGGGPCSGVYQFTANSNLSSSIEATVQRGSNPFTFTLYAGMFDNNYYVSANSTGNLYVCGNTLGSGTLYQIPVTAGTMSTTATAGPQLSGIFGLTANAPCSPVTEIFNPNAGGPPGLDKIFLSTTGSGANFCGSGCLFDLPVTSWQPRTNYAVGEEITDNFLNVQVVTTAGTSGNTPPPTWSSPGNITIDNSVAWTGKEGLGSTSFPAWQAGVTYSTGSAILDTNGNVEVEAFANAKSGATQPTWALTIGAHTSDNAASWTNLGPVDNFLLGVNGGTSGIVVDNTVPSGTLAGGSQIYFSPLGLGFSTCGAGNGCAVQASQSGLN